MPTSLLDPEVQAVINDARSGKDRRIRFDNSDDAKVLPKPHPSPEDWRDHWIYLLMVDRFNNPAAAPTTVQQSQRYDTPFLGFQGGTLDGVRQRLSYLRDLGVGAIWLTPVLKNCRYFQGRACNETYHGYGIQDFLTVDPRFAADQQHPEWELRCLVDEAHKEGMYVILDMVLNHTGDVFAYPGDQEPRPPDDPTTTYPIFWRDERGNPRQDWTSGKDIVNPDRDAAVFPAEIRRNEYFRRQGGPRGRDSIIGDFPGDPPILKQLLTEDPALQDHLIRAYQYVIAKYDFDAFRIDTLRFLSPNFSRTFSNAIREFALSIGKKNFFIFGEIWTGKDLEDLVSTYIGRGATNPDDLIGVDAVQDISLLGTMFKYPGVIKGGKSPIDIVSMYQERKCKEEGRIASHAEATSFFVTFIDNQDIKPRFYYSLDQDPHRYDDQVLVALCCLFTLQGIPCVYYGTEQGLRSTPEAYRLPASALKPEAVREALWGKPNAFDPGHPFYTAIQQLAQLRQEQPALRYGRQYMRQVSGDGQTFAYSTFVPGVLAYSRILNQDEVVVVANMDMQSGCTVDVIVDMSLNPAQAPYRILHSNNPAAAAPGAVTDAPPNVVIVDANGKASGPPARSIRVTLGPMEVQLLSK